MKKILALHIFISLSLLGFSQSAICLDLGQPINTSNGQILVNYDVVASTCTPNVRLNFILGPWNSPEDTTLYSGKTWFRTYSEIIDSLMFRGINVYALVGAQMSYNFIGDLLIDYPSAVPGDSALAAQWEQDYVSTFVKVVDLFKDKVRTFECYNEPNNWDNGWTSVVHPKWFSLILQDIYLNVKYFNGHDTDPAWQVNLISGPILTHDLDNGATYLDNTYWYGKNEWAWDWTMQQTGSYPLDGIGMHIYCEQGSNDSATITNAMLGNINAMWNTIASWEGATSKQIWISEFGWESSAVTEQGQADNLRNGFYLLLNDSRIGLATFFTIHDWPGYYWGLYYFGNFSTSDRKLAYYEFLNLTNCTGTGISNNSNTVQPVLMFNATDGNYILNNIDINSEIEIWNMMGEKIRQINPETNTISVCKKEIGGSSGIYFLSVKNSKAVYSFKLMFD